MEGENDFPADTVYRRPQLKLKSPGFRVRNIKYDPELRDSECRSK